MIAALLRAFDACPPNVIQVLGLQHLDARQGLVRELLETVTRLQAVTLAAPNPSVATAAVVTVASMQAMELQKLSPQQVLLADLLTRVMQIGAAEAARETLVNGESLGSSEDTKH